jgi:Tfp pilus assembly protein PilF
MLPNTVQQEEVLTHLEAVTASPAFGNSARRAQLLRYLVERTLAGEGSRISEYAIGVDVLGRPVTFDPRTESIVRTEMTRLRQKLKEYYSHADGVAGPSASLTRIELPLRTYTPRFVFREPEARPAAALTPELAAPDTPHTPVTDPERAGLAGRLSVRAALVAAVVVLGGASLVIWQVRRPLQAGRQPVPQTTSNSQAHDLYLKGSSEAAQATPEAYRKAISLFHDALQKDPSYAAAYLSVAKDEQGLILLMAESPQQGTAEMERALEKALAVDPGLGEARGLLAELRSIRDWDWTSAEREYRLAIDQGAPAFVDMMYGWGLATRGRFGEAHAQLRLAQDLEPLSLEPRFFEALVYYLENRFDGAKKLLRQILDLNPDYLPAHGLWGLVAALERNCAEAAPQIEWFARKSSMPVASVLLAWGSACQGQRARAEHYLRQASQTSGPGYASPYNIAVAYAMLHENDKAIEYLEKSAADHEPQILYLKYVPGFTDIRTDPRYVALERKVGLDP